MGDFYPHARCSQRAAALALAGHVEGVADVEREVAWLANVLRSRGFPLERLARNLELAADVVGEQVAEPGPAVADRLRAAAAGLP